MHRSVPPFSGATLVLSNARGERIELAPEGAAIVGIFVRDRRGAIDSVSVAAGGSAGKTIGRYANRIGGGRFTLDGRTYRLLVNEGGNTLHGGPDGFSKRRWSVAASQRDDEGRSLAAFTLFSPDGDQGFPGALNCSVTFTFGDDATLRIEYAATAEAPTVINLTNHVYFNLGGAGAPVENQQLRIAASAYTPVDDSMIPTGEIAPVEGTAFDFRRARPIGRDPYDCNFAIDGRAGELRFAAEARDVVSGRRLTVETTQPGLQLYTGEPGAFALETQHFADSPNHPNFPSTVLRPGQTFRSSTAYAFSAEALD